MIKSLILVSLSHLNLNICSLECTIIMNPGMMYNIYEYLPQIVSQ